MSFLNLIIAFFSANFERFHPTLEILRPDANFSADQLTRCSIEKPCRG